MIERWQQWQDPDQAGVSIALGLWLGVLIGFDVDINTLKVSRVPDQRHHRDAGPARCYPPAAR